MVDKYGDIDGDTLDQEGVKLSFSEILKKAQEDIGIDSEVETSSKQVVDARNRLKQQEQQNIADNKLGVTLNPWDQIRDSMLEDEMLSTPSDLEDDVGFTDEGLSESYLEAYRKSLELGDTDGDTLDKSSGPSVPADVGKVDGGVKVTPWDFVRGKVDEWTENSIIAADEDGKLKDIKDIEPISNPDLIKDGIESNHPEFEGDRNEGLSGMTDGTDDYMVGDTFVEGQAPRPKQPTPESLMRPPVNMITESRYNKVGVLLAQIKDDNVQEDYANMAVAFESKLSDNMERWDVTEDQFTNDPALFKDFMVKQSIDTANSYFGHDQFSARGSGFPSTIVDSVFQPEGSESETAVISKFLDGFESTYGKRMDDYGLSQEVESQIVDSVEDDFDLEP